MVTQCFPWEWLFGDLSKIPSELNWAQHIAKQSPFCKGYTVWRSSKSVLGTGMETDLK